MLITFRRKYRSSRKTPSLTALSRSRLVVASRRISTLTGRLLDHCGGLCEACIDLIHMGHPRAFSQRRRQRHAEPGREIPTSPRPAHEVSGRRFADLLNLTNQFPLHFDEATIPGARVPYLSSIPKNLAPFTVAARMASMGVSPASTHSSSSRCAQSP